MKTLSISSAPNEEAEAAKPKRSEPSTCHALRLLPYYHGGLSERSTSFQLAQKDSYLLRYRRKRNNKPVVVLSVGLGGGEILDLEIQ